MGVTANLAPPSTKTKTDANYATLIDDIRIGSDSLDPAQLDPLHWLKINQVQLRFNQDIDEFDTKHYGLAGFHVPDYASKIIDISHNAADRTVTITLDSPIIDDQLLLVASDEISGADGPLDGEWTTQQIASESGDGIPGGNFEFRFDILAGDVNRSGSIDTLDATDINRRLMQSIGQPNYDAFADIDGNNRINMADLFYVFRNRGTELPKGTPISPLTMPGLAAAIDRREDDELEELDES